MLCLRLFQLLLCFNKPLGNHIKTFHKETTVDLYKTQTPKMQCNITQLLK